MMSIFRNRDFSKLFTARLISTIGDKFFSFAVEWWIISSAIENGKAILGFIMGAATLGTILFAPMAGVFSDRYSKKKCMVVALSGGAIVIALLLMFLPTFLLLPMLFAVPQVLLMAFESLFQTSMQSSLNYIVGKEQLSQAVSITSSIQPISIIVGSILAGLLIEHWGISGAFTVDMLTFLLSVVFVIRIATVFPIKHVAKKAKSVKNTFVQDLKEVVLFLYRDKPLFYVVLILGIINFFMGPITISLPILAKETFNGTAMTMSLFQSMMGAGTVIGAMVLSFVTRPLNQYVVLFRSTLVIGLMYLVTVIHSQMIVSGALVVIGIAMVAVNISAMVMAQNYVPTYIQGRFFSIVTSLLVIITPLGFSVTGFLANHFPIEYVLGGCGIMLCLISPIILFIPRIKITYTI